MAASLKADNFRNNDEMIDMVSLFQQLYHLNVSGNLDSQTLKQMSAPRCGFPDILTPDEKSENRMVSSFRTCNFNFLICKNDLLAWEITVRI